MKSTNPLANLLGKSPFRPVQEHMRAAAKCVELVAPLFEALIAGDRAALEEKAKQIDEAESEADLIKNTFRAHMPSTLLLPVGRRDLLSVVSEQDKIADAAEDVAKILTDRDLPAPGAIHSPLRALVSSSAGAVTQAARAVEELDELLEVGFGKGKQVEAVTEMILELRHKEQENDDLVSAFNRTLFSIEGEIGAVDAVFWYRLVDLLGDVANHAENVGDRLLLLLAR